MYIDILFVIYLYQMWIYPIDMKRTNEFGQTFSVENKSEKDDKTETIIISSDEKIDLSSLETDKASVTKRKIKNKTQE